MAGFPIKKDKEIAPMDSKKSISGSFPSKNSGKEPENLDSQGVIEDPDDDGIDMTIKQHTIQWQNAIQRVAESFGNNHSSLIQKLSHDKTKFLHASIIVFDDQEDAAKFQAKMKLNDFVVSRKGGKGTAVLVQHPRQSIPKVAKKELKGTSQPKTQLNENTIKGKNMLNESADLSAIRSKIAIKRKTLDALRENMKVVKERGGESKRSSVIEISSHIDEIKSEIGDLLVQLKKAKVKPVVLSESSDDFRGLLKKYKAKKNDHETLTGNIHTFKMAKETADSDRRSVLQNAIREHRIQLSDVSKEKGELKDQIMKHADYAKHKEKLAAKKAKPIMEGVEEHHTAMAVKFEPKTNFHDLLTDDHYDAYHEHKTSSQPDWLSPILKTYHSKKSTEHGEHVKEYIKPTHDMHMDASKSHMMSHHRNSILAHDTEGARKAFHEKVAEYHKKKAGEHYINAMALDFSK